MGSNENKKIEELQILESHLQHILAQKQGIQVELNEVDNAISEIKNAGEEVYKVVAGIMLKSTAEKLNKELEERKKTLDSKMNAVAKQEKLLEDKASELRTEIVGKA